MHAHANAKSFHKHELNEFLNFKYYDKEARNRLNEAFQVEIEITHPGDLLRLGNSHQELVY